MKFIKKRVQGELFDALISLQNDDAVMQIVFSLGWFRFYFGYAKMLHQFFFRRFNNGWYH